MKGTYAIVGIAAGAAILGFSGYKYVQSTSANSEQKLVMNEMSMNGGGTSGPADGENAGSLPPGGSVGDGQPNSGAIHQEGQGSNQGGGNFMGRGPRGNRGNGFEGGGGSAQPPMGNTPGGNSSQEPGQRSGPPNEGSVNMPQKMDMFAMGTGILTSPKVLTELKLDAGQKEAINQAMKPPSGQEDPSQDPQAAIQNMMNMSEERGKKVKAILNDAQEKRYVQLVYQSFGPSMLMQPQSKDQFGISDEEGKKMMEAAQSFMKDSMSGMQGGNIDINAIMKKKDEFDKKLIGMLDADSQGKWKAATGAPFKFDTMMGMGGMFGGPGGGGRRMGGGRPGGR